MASAPISSLNHKEFDELPKENFWDVADIFKWEGFWYGFHQIESIKAFQSHFQACDDDVILASFLKTGTTWLKALCVSIIGRQSSHRQQLGGDEEEEEKDLLVRNISHFYVPTLEVQVYEDASHPDLSGRGLGMPSPRLFHTHLPYNTLPDSIKNSKCKIVYITRNSKDTLVSFWHFFNKILRPGQDPFPFEKAFESFCNGVHVYGPFFDHILSYCTENLKMPHKILFIKYEDLKSNPMLQVKKLASFLGKPFEEGDEEEIEKVIRRCSFERLKNLDVNQNGAICRVPNSFLFRMGTVGDWKNHFTPEMSQRLDQIALMKLQNAGLDLEMNV
ncbi:cytosolic sulfotransferase 5-like [Hevea brasiliensis]|uniref:cytosolic sulfotransferase 5-like n=1 Tax=Hevea brasiliensis TaxID=3981 RepID=UPI0025DF55AE|nr:cytosolic sulfotransferase 5-like [Hevea brasiliensis]